MMLLRLSLLLVLCCPMAAPSAETVPSLTNLAAMLLRSEICSYTTNDSDVSWLVGTWKCEDRALRGHRDVPSLYAFVDTVRIEPDSFYTPPFPPGLLHLDFDCTFIRIFAKDPNYRQMLIVEFAGSDFKFWMPHPDFMRLRKEPVKRPNWFILEHQDVGDVLLFRRLESRDDPSAARKL